MAKRDNHYEAAFEAYLRERCIPYVAVDEARRSLAEEGSLKSLDFIVSPQGGRSWLVDVKGRRFPAGEAQREYWRNWSPRDDLVSLTRWHQLFGADFAPLLVFAYWLTADRSPLPAEHVFTFRQTRYAFVGIRLRDYAAHARPISTRWDTVAMPRRLFRHLAQAVDDLFAAGEFVDPGEHDFLMTPSA